MLKAELRQALSVAVKRGRDGYDEGPSMILWYARQSGLIVIRLSRQLYTSEPQSERRSNTAGCLPWISRRCAPKQRCRLDTWKGVLQQLETLRGELELLQEYTRGTPARS